MKKSIILLLLLGLMLVGCANPALTQQEVSEELVTLDSVEEAQAESRAFKVTYEAEGPYLFHEIGRRIPGAWRVTVRDPRNRYMTYGPYVRHLPRTYLAAKFYLRIDNNSADNLPVCQIEVVTNYGHTVLARKVIRRREFWAPFQYQKFTLPFDNRGGGNLEFRVKYLGYAQIDHDKTIVDD